MPEPVPEFLYRYRNFDGNNIKFIERIIKCSQIFFASPNSFNDPFDCKVHFIISKHKIKQEYNNILKDKFPSADRRQRRRKLSDEMREFNDRKFIAGLQKMVDKYGVLSLTSDSTNVLMWSHYACVRGYVYDSPFQ